METNQKLKKRQQKIWEYLEAMYQEQKTRAIGKLAKGNKRIKTSKLIAGLFLFILDFRYILNKNFKTFRKKTSK